VRRARGLCTGRLSLWWVWGWLCAVGNDSWLLGWWFDGFGLDVVSSGIGVDGGFRCWRGRLEGEGHGIWV
jgi:hypothetical protein